MVHILLVDDDPRIRSIIREYAQTEEWDFTEAKDGGEALSVLSDGSFDLVVLDVMMPKTDGWQVLKHLRKTSAVPVIMLTARVEEYDRLLGFDLGVDDYVSKPFSPRELIARIKALLKRSGNTQNEPSFLDFGGLAINFSAHSVQLDGTNISLTPKEYDLLAFLSSHPGNVFTRDQLLNHIWGYDYYGDARTVDTHIRTLREKLGPYHKFITTVWGTGYRFDTEGNQSL
jgi:DNA-binding response OmpR family regulator